MVNTYATDYINYNLLMLRLTLERETCLVDEDLILRKQK